MRVPIDKLRSHVQAMLEPKFGPTIAAETTEYLIWAEMAGISTQGIVKLTGPNALQYLEVEGEPTVDRETANTTLINGRNAPAPYVACLISDAAVRLARISGSIGVSGYHNVRSSSGALAYYCERASRAGYIGIMMARSPAITAPYAGREAVFGTNPIAYSIPTLDEPITYDAATSASTKFGVILAERRGESLDPGVAIDAEGNPTTDPRRVLNGGALLPFGGHKGSGLGLLVEIMAGPLVSASFADVTGEWGALFLAVDPSALGGSDCLRRSASELANRVRQSGASDDECAPRCPGDRATESYRRAENEGTVDIADDLLSEVGYPG